MAYTGFGESFNAPRAQAGGNFRRLIAGLFAWRFVDNEEAPQVLQASARKLAGPDPRDQRARGYMADLDMEVGF